MTKPMPLALLLAACLALPACGDGDGSPGKTLAPEDMGVPSDFDPNDPDAVKDLVSGFTRSIADAELNDRVLEDLYGIHQKVMAVDGNPAKALAAFQGTSWNMAAYTKAMMKFEALRNAGRRGVDKMQKELDEARAELAKLEARVAEAGGDEKAALEQQLSMMKMMLPSMEEHAKVAAQLKNPEVRALVEKWSAKFDALEDE